MQRKKSLGKPQAVKRKENMRTEVKLRAEKLTPERESPTLNATVFSRHQGARARRLKESGIEDGGLRSLAVANDEGGAP